jgi:hypothetical protein
LSSLILVMVFVLLLFAIGQFVLSQTLARQETKALADLNDQIAQLAKTLSLAQDNSRALDAKGPGTLRFDRQSKQRARCRKRRSSTAAQAEAAKLNADVAALNDLKAQLEREGAAAALDSSTSRRRNSSPRPTSTRNRRRRSNCSIGSLPPCATSWRNCRRARRRECERHRTRTGRSPTSARN